MERHLFEKPNDKSNKELKMALLLDMLLLTFLATHKP
jgi:hypothetical protein